MALVTRTGGLRYKIMAWSFVPTAIILLAVAWVTFYAYRDVTEDLVIERNRELARLSAGQLATDIGGHAGLLSAVGHTLSHAEGIEEQREALRLAANRLVVFDGGVVVLDNFGHVIATEPSRPELMGADWAERSYFREIVRSPQPVFSNILPGGPDGSSVVVVAVPIEGLGGEFMGAVAGMFRTDAAAVSAFYGGILKLRMGNSGRVYLVDGTGKLIYDSRRAPTGEDISQEAVVKKVLTGSVGDERTTNAAGEEIVAGYAPVPGTPWGLVTEESWTALMSSSLGWRRFLLFLLALGVIVPALVVTFAVQRITQPIAALIAAAQEVAGGNFGRTITARTGDEIEELAEQFNAMSAQLQESYATLEQRVSDRTRELATLNAIAGVVSHSLDLSDILQDALDKTLEIMGMGAGGAYRLEEDKSHGAEGCCLILMACRGLGEDSERAVQRLPLEPWSPGQVGARFEPVIRQVSGIPAGEMRQAMEREEFVQIVIIPLVAKGRLLGTMNLGARAQRWITTEELSLLSSIGQQIGVAVENARLYERAEEVATAAERGRLARDLHDAVTQTLFSASLIAEVLPKLWERRPDEAYRRLEELRQLTRGALAEMRTLLLELRPAALTEAALSDLLRQLGESITGRARVPVALTVDGDCCTLPVDVKVALYRIAQEALNNVAKHSAATQADVRLVCTEDRVELSVRDDGKGFDPASIPPNHLGVGIMRERADGVGALLQVDSTPGEGTHIQVCWAVPLRKADELVAAGA